MKKLSLNEMQGIQGGGGTDKDHFATGIVCGVSAALMFTPAAVIGFAGLLACGTFTTIIVAV
ncbi:MAG: hypothetical protein EAZ08_07890 [Cytophagales bacterium]|nr:MAG: hypothetical protein EAZ08_07890 [Cytophagales bacterium]